MAIVEASHEGTIQQIDPIVQGGVTVGLTILSMGVTIRYLPGPVRLEPPAAAGVKVRQKSIKSPSQRLTIQDVLAAAPFPGISYPGNPPVTGFTNGTVIAEGFYDSTSAPGFFDANHLEVEPAENVLIGALTDNSAGVIKINNTVAIPLTHNQLSTNPESPATPVFKNEFGFPISPDPTSVIPTPVGPNPPPPAAAPAPTAAEGYFAQGQFHFHNFEYGGPGTLLAPPNTPLISVIRAQVRDRGDSFEIDIRGHASTPHQPPGGPRQNIQVRVRDMLAGTFGTKPQDWEYRGGSELSSLIPGTLRLDLRTPAGVVPEVHRWRFEATLPKGGIHVLPPERFEIRNKTAEDAVHINVRVEEDADVRDA